jgi:pyruvate formate lyase activating enzyme
MCSGVCPSGDITVENNRVFFSRKNCISCKSCGNICLQNAIRFVGEKLSVSGIMDVITRDKAYYRTSEGGATFTGGEPFVQFEGLMELLVSCKEEGIHTAVETCGQADPQKVKKAYPLIDLFLYDIKHTEKERLKTETGADLDLIYTNLSYLAESDPGKIIMRVPVIPAFNYNVADIGNIFRLAREKKINNIHLLPYHVLGKDKYVRMGRACPFPGSRMLAKDDLLPLKKTGESMGLNVRIG